ncbi:MAG: MFS transporter, partial [Candidatus Hodarchaeota archaeon]
MQLTKKTSNGNDIVAKNNYIPVDYRAWPIFVLSFIRLVFVSIFERAMQNFLYFEINISESTLGFISSAGAIAYIFGPLFGSAITRKLGTRNSIIISSFATPILTTFQLLYFEPWFLITCRVLSGLMLGLYWPNLLNLLSNWQKVSSVEKAKKNFKNFNFSWNFGLLFGLFFGFIWAFSWNDYLAMILSWLISFLLIPISFFIKKDIKAPKSEKVLKIHAEDARTDLTPIATTETNSNTPMIVYPILFSWLGIMVLTISKSTFIFSFPVFLKASENPSYYTYIVQFGLQAAQLTGLTWINRMKVFTRRISALVGIVGIVFVSLTVILFENIWYAAI